MRCLNCPNAHHLVNSTYDLKCPNAGHCLMKDVELREKYSQFNLSTASKICFENEKRFLKIIDKDDRYLICDKRGKFYMVCDLQECIRGTVLKQDNILQLLKSGDVQISLDNWKVLDIKEVK